MSEAINLCRLLTEAVEEKDRIYEETIACLTQAKEGVAALKAQCEGLEGRIQTLKYEKRTLEDKLEACRVELMDALADQREFTKVSQVVMLERENAKLHEDVELLNARLEKLLKKGPSGEGPQGVCEKKIKGTTYYVSEDDEMIIYKVMENGTLGPKLGRLEKQDGRTKAVWD